jgi:DNA-binding CsgD family transcriptional regulator
MPSKIARAIMRPEVADECGMDDHDADKAAILAVLRAETDAWLRRDFDALARHWVHAPGTRRMTSHPSSGTYVVDGWEAIGADLRSQMQHASRSYDITERLSWDRVNIVVGADMAWVSYDQIGTDSGDEFELAGVQHELKIFHRVDGNWKIGCLVIMQSNVDRAACPLIEVDPQARVLWMNREARDRMHDHTGLVVAAGRLRSRRRGHDVALRCAINSVFEHLRSRSPLGSPVARLCRVVPLGESEGGAPLFCWVLPEDSKVLVSFDDAQMVARRIGIAAEVFCLSPAQVRLARLIVDGHDLAAASDLLGVSINTLRTQLQRMFDKTGARSQAALVRSLLSADAPIK